MNSKRSLLVGALLAALSVVSLDAHPRRGHHRHDHHWDARPRGPFVTFYEHAHFRGASLTVEIGAHIPNLSHARFDNGEPVNDRISSVRVHGPAAVVAFEHSGFHGYGITLVGDVPNLEWIQGRWNDVISSLEVRPAGRAGW